MRIHREGVKILITILFILLVLIVLGWVLLGLVGAVLLAISIPFYIFVLRFFRVPKRPVSENTNAVLSPCDGKVVVIEEVDETEFLNTRCLQVSIFMSVWNVHINWYPLAGNVLYQKYHPGEFLLAWEPKSSTLNERTTVVVEHATGAKVLFRQIAGYLARRIVCYAKAGDKADQGQEMGFIKFGSRVDLFLPLNSVIKVQLNQKVVGRQTEIAMLPKA